MSSTFKNPPRPASKQPRGVLDLEWLVNYSTRAAARYGRPVSLVMISSHDDMKRVREVLQDFMRSCDAPFDMDQVSALLMDNTDRNGALRAIERLRERLGEETNARFSVASFPDDTKEPAGLLITANRRLHRSLGMWDGAVVDQD